MSSALDRLLVSASRARPGLAIHTEIALREAHAGDESGLAPITPSAVIVARDADDVSAVLSLATHERVSVTPRAGATGKAGGAIPDADGIALVLTGLDRELEIDAGDRIAVAGAGVVLAKLREAAREQHLFYGPDPSSLESATIGGNVATNASGPSSLKHGSTARWVRGLEVVTGAGTHLAMPSHVSKSTVGLDLAQLFVGSEGMLGVVTRVFLRLEPVPARVALASVSLSSLEAIGAALVAIDRAHIAPRAIELLDDEALSTLRAARTDHALDPRAVAILFVELEGSEHGGAGPGTGAREHGFASSAPMAKTRTVAPPGPPRRRAYSGATAAASTPGAEATSVAGTPSFRATAPTAWRLRVSRCLIKDS